MDRVTAFATLKHGEARFKIEAGCLMRGSIRRLAAQYCVDFYEEKGWLESVFVFRSEKDRVIKFRDVIMKVFSEN